MRLDLGEYLCQYCGSENIRCAEWQDSRTDLTEDDFFFSDEVTPYTRENITAIGDAKLLFRCDQCSRFFVINIAPRGIAATLLPFSRTSLELRIPIEFDPHSGRPQLAFVGGVPMSVREFSLAASPGWARYEPFYPYPQGRFLLGMEAANLPDGHRCYVRVEVDAPHPPLFMTRRDPDLDLYRFSVSWADSDAAAVLQLLQSLDAEGYSDFSGANAMLRGLPELLESLRNLRATATDYRRRISQASATARSSAAFRFFAWFEHAIRDFVWSAYTRLFLDDATDADWWHEHFPDEVRSKILTTARKEAKLKRAITGQLPMEYTDFGHIVTLIEHIWPKLNLQIDSDLEALRGHFRYLRALRNSVAHARLLSHEDLMLIQEHALRVAELLEMKDFAKKLAAPFYARPGIL